MNTTFLISLAFDPEQNSLRTLSIDLKNFESIDNALPNHLKELCIKYDSSPAIYDELVRNKAVIHKNCRSLYNVNKFERRKRKFDEINVKENNNDEPKTCAEEDSTPRSTRGKVKIKTFTSTCFFCEEGEEKGHLHDTWTIEYSKNVKTMAIELGDSILLAKLSQGDMIATEARYHKSCSTNLWNRYRCLYSKAEDLSEKFLEGKF